MVLNETDVNDITLFVKTNQGLIDMHKQIKIDIHKQIKTDILILEYKYKLNAKFLPPFR